jgi:WD40 repeat protein
LCVWKTIDWQKAWEKSAVTAAAFDALGTYGVAASGSHISFWQASSGQVVRDFLYPASVQALEFYSGARLLIASITFDERLWLRYPAPINEKEFEFELYKLSDGMHRFSPIAFSPDGRWISALGNDFKVHLWDVRTLSETRQFPYNGTFGIRLVFSADSKLLAVVSPEDHLVSIWDINAHSILTCIEHRDTGDFNSRLPRGDILFAPGNDRFISADEGNEALVWQLPSADETRWSCDPGLCLNLRFSPDGQWLALTGTPAREKGDFIVGGRWVVAKEMWATLIVLNSSTGRTMFSVLHGAHIEKLAFDPSSEFIATQCKNGELRIWNVKTQCESSGQHNADEWLVEPNGPIIEQVLTRPHIALIRDKLAGVKAISPDGRWLAAEEGKMESRDVRVFDTSTAREVAQFRHNEPINALAFSPDSAWLAVASLDHALRLWMVAPELLIDQACSRLTADLTQEDWKLYLGDEDYRSTRETAAAYLRN